MQVGWYSVLKPPPAYDISFHSVVTPAEHSVFLAISVLVGAFSVKFKLHKAGFQALAKLLSF